MRDHRAEHAGRLTRYEQLHEAGRAAGSQPDPYARATLEFGLAYERAVLAWFDQLPPAVGGDAVRRSPPGSAAPSQ